MGVAGPARRLKRHKDRLRIITVFKRHANPLLIMALIQGMYPAGIISDFGTFSFFRLEELEEWWVWCRFNSSLAAKIAIPLQCFARKMQHWRACMITPGCCSKADTPLPRLVNSCFHNNHASRIQIYPVCPPVSGSSCPPF